MTVVKRSFLLGIKDIEAFKQFAKEKTVMPPVNDLTPMDPLTSATASEYANFIDCGEGKLILLSGYTDDIGINYLNCSVGGDGSIVIDNTVHHMAIGLGHLVNEHVHAVQHSSIRDHILIYDVDGGSEYAYVVKLNATMTGLESVSSIHIGAGNNIAFVAACEEGFILTVKHGYQVKPYVFSIDSKSITPFDISLDSALSISRDHATTSDVLNECRSDNGYIADARTLYYKNGNRIYAVVSVGCNTSISQRRIMWLRHYNASTCALEERYYITDAVGATARYLSRAYSDRGADIVNGLCFMIYNGVTEILDLETRQFKSTGVGASSIMKVTYSPTLMSLIAGKPKAVLRFPLAAS